MPTTVILASFRQIFSATFRPYSTMAPAKTQAAARDFLSFVNASPTPYHAVKSAKDRLTKAGFKEIKVSGAHPQKQVANVRRRRKNRGLQHVTREESTTSPEMARPSLHSQ